MVSNDPRTFVVDVVGSVSKQHYQGTFKVRPLLSHRQKLQRDEMKRQLLGVNPEGASNDAFKTAVIFSKIWAHLADAPGWWKDAGNGIDLLDEEPVSAVVDKIVEFETEVTASVTKEGEKSKEVLKEVAKNK